MLWVFELERQVRKMGVGFEMVAKRVTRRLSGNRGAPADFLPGRSMGLSA